MVRYNFDELIKKANRLDEILPKLIGANNWDAILSELEISSTIWSGPVADTYARICKSVCRAHSIETTLDLPNKIRSHVEAMMEVEKKESSCF